MQDNEDILQLVLLQYLHKKRKSWGFLPHLFSLDKNFLNVLLLSIGQTSGLLSKIPFPEYIQNHFASVQKVTCFPEAQLR